MILIGRLTRDPEVRYSDGNEKMRIARYTLAVDRKIKQEGQQSADFIGCVAFGKSAEFAEKYLRQGTKIAVTGRIQTGSYTNREGRKIYKTDVVVEEQEFTESKTAAAGSQNRQQEPQRTETDENGFMSIPDGIDEEMPFL